MTDSRPPSVHVNLKPQNLNGKLLTFCGVDGAGKSTSLEIAAKYLEKLGVNYLAVKMPSTAARSLSYFRTYAEDHTTATRGIVDLPSLCIILLGDRLMTLREQVLPSLSNGTWVLCDRYIWTTLAELHAVRCDEYQMCVLRSIVEMFPKPDISFVSNVSADVAIRRIKSRHDEQHFNPNRELFIKFLEGFREVSQVNDLCIFSSEQDIENTKSLIYKRIDKLINDNGLERRK
jgi:dTMP kinase